MAVVRIEVDFDVDLDGGVQSAGTARVELDDPSGDLPHLLERANGAMLRLLPQKETTKAEPQTILTLNNVRCSQVDRGVLFGSVQGGPGSAGTARVNVTLPPTQQKGQCQDRCPTDEAGHPPCRCELPLGHGSKHRAHSTGHGWPNPRGEDLGGVPTPAESCGETLQFGDCPKPKGHGGKCVDNGRCASCCPESHRPPRQCALAQGHRGSHEAEDCLWSGQELHRADEVESREMCSDRVYWLGKAYNCNRPEGHPDHHENADQGFRWEIDGSLQICSGEWGYDIYSPLSGGLACRLPEGHDGDCGPLPDADRGGPEAVDCA